jgi:hypothetical protein
VWRGQVLDCIDAGVHRLCGRSLRGSDGLDRIVGMHRMCSWRVCGLDGIDQLQALR